MNADDRQHEFAKRLRQRLERSVDDVDELTAARLQAARKRALAQCGERRSVSMWLSAGGFATAAVAVLAVLLWNGGMQPLPDDLTPTDWELLAESDLPLIEELDFYDWLEEEDLAG